MVFNVFNGILYFTSFSLKTCSS